MATVFPTGRTPMAFSGNLTGIQRYMLRRFHPRSIFIDSTALIWFVYFLWNQDWRAAVATVILGRILAFVSVMNMDVEHFSETVLGRIALLHLHPLNMSIQIVGAVMAIFGVWRHDTMLILGGTSLVLLGHIFGWSQVDSRFGSRGQNVL